MKKSIYAGILGLFLIAIVSASQLTIVDEMDSFTGVKLMIKSSNDSLGDPIYPTTMDSAAGVAYLDIDSNDTAAILKIFIINHGEVVKEIERGPFDLTLDNKIDLRLGASDENISTEKVNNELMNVSVETALKINSILIEDVEGNITNDSADSLGNSSDSVTGFSISSLMDSKAAPWTLGLVGLVIVGVVIFVVAKVSYKKGVEAEMRDITRFSEMNKNL